MLNFHYIQVLLNGMYGIDMEDADIEEFGLIAWELIGNKNRRLYKYSTNIDPSDNSVTLPCNALDINGDSCIELVTSSYEDWNSTTNKTNFGDLSTAYTEQLIESLKQYLGHYYIPGKVLKYDLVGNKLYFTHNYGRINILYKGILFDEEGLPEISDKEALAIATYLAYMTKYKEGLKTNNGDLIKLSLTLYNLWQKQCDLARTKLLSLNEFDSILETYTSWDRKFYSKGYKPFK